MTSQVIIFGERLRDSPAAMQWDFDDNAMTKFLWSSYNPFVKMLLYPQLFDSACIRGMPSLPCVTNPTIGYTSIKMMSGIFGSYWEITPAAIDEMAWDRYVDIVGWVAESHYPRFDWCDVPAIYLEEQLPGDGMVKVHQRIEVRFLLGSLVGRLLDYRRQIGSNFREYRLIALVS